MLIHFIYYYKILQIPYNSLCIQLFNVIIVDVYFIVIIVYSYILYMTGTQTFDLLLLAIGIVVAMVSAVLYRVWAIPAIQQKIEMLDKESHKTRDNMHDVRNILHEHELRISVIEKTPNEK